jgi:NADPH2:quinone reductase
MTHAIRIHRHGGPEVLQWEPVELRAPAPDEVVIRHTAVGLNFYEVYERTGLYPTGLPHIPGREAAGVIEALGSAVRHLAVGDRVAYVANTSGAYAERRVLPAERVVRLPKGIDEPVAAAIMLKGLTAQMLLRQVYRVRKNDFVVIHAAAGGVGSLAVQWAAHLGARVIGIVGTAAKAEHVRDLGAEQVFLTEENWVERIKELTRNQGVHVVYDSVGKDTFMHSLDCLRPRGMMVTYGNSSGPVEPFSPLELARRGSLFLTRPTLFDYIRARSALVKAVQELFDLVLRGAVKVEIGQTFPLREAAAAHRLLESRQTRASTVLLP